MNKILQLDINVGIGDHLMVRFFLDQIKDQFQKIQITHSRAAVAYWRNNDPEYWKFIHDLGDIIFSEEPYQLFKNPIYFPFWPSEKFMELGIKPTKPNIPNMIVNHNLTAEINEPYIILTTKIREMKRTIFKEFLKKLSPIIKQISSKYKIVLLGEREVEKSKEYLVGDNSDIIYSAYSSFKELIPESIDLTIPALGIKVPNIKQLQHDCYLMSKSQGVIALGIGGNVWLSTICAPITYCLHADTYNVPSLFEGTLPELFLTRNIDDFFQKLETL